MARIDIPKIEIKDLKALAPLLDSRPRDVLVLAGDRLSGGKFGDNGYYVCTGCGGTCRQLMMRRHKKGCPWVAHYKAIEKLQEILGE